MVILEVIYCWVYHLKVLVLEGSRWLGRHKPMREAAHIVMHTYVHNMHAHFCTQCDNRGAAFCLSPNACSMAQHLWVQSDMCSCSLAKVMFLWKAPLKNKSCQDRLWGMQWYGPQNDSNALGLGPTVRATFPEDGRVWPLPVPMPRKCLRMAVGPCWTHGQIRQVVSPFGSGLYSSRFGFTIQQIHRENTEIERERGREREIIIP